jgi:hypothetical protein
VSAAGTPAAGTPAAGTPAAGTPAAETPAARAARLLRWYPRAWRDRYGDEFTELLICDIEERPRSAGRTLDVARGGLVARLTAAGLAGRPLPAPGSGVVTPQVRYRQVSASLGSLGGALAVFFTAAAALWSELVIYRQALPRSPLPSPAAPAAQGAHLPPASTALLATDVISAAMLALLALAVLAALPVLATLAVRFRSAGQPGRPGHPARRALAIPAAGLLAGVTFLFIGGRHFGNGWPGTGGHGSFVPAGLAAFEWATSLSVSAYWAHPAPFFAQFPRPEVYWMATSPLALAASVAAAVVLVRRAALSPRVLALEVRLATGACAVMAVVLGAAAWWVATSGGHQAAASGALRPPFHAGLIDVACTGILAAALPVAARAARLARRELRLARGTS